MLKLRREKVERVSVRWSQSIKRVKLVTILEKESSRYKGTEDGG